MKDDSKLKKHLELWDGTGQLLHIDELDVCDIKIIAAEVFESIKNNDGDMYKQYLSILTKYGIMCPHPQHKRLYANKKMSYPSSYHPSYDCEMCGCSVLNEDYVSEHKESSRKGRNV